MRRTVLAILYALLSLLMCAEAARADEVPNLHVARLCRDIASHSPDFTAEKYSTASFEQCMKGERETREQLHKRWGEFIAGEKRQCVALATMGGSSSYTVLLTCLEMASYVRNLRQSSSGNAAKGGTQE
jgi:hypothetical protein